MNAKTDPKIKIIKKPHEKWNIQIKEEDNLLLTVTTDSRELGVRIAKRWITICYPQAKRSNIFANISKTHNGAFQARMIQNGHNKCIVKREETEFWKEMKRFYLQKELGGPSTYHLLMPYEITPVIENALQIELLNGSLIKIYNSDNHLKNQMIESRNYQYMVNCEIIDKKNYPNIFGMIDSSSYDLQITLKDFHYWICLRDSKTQEIQKEQIGDNIKETLQALEFDLENELEKVLERSVTK